MHVRRASSFFDFYAHDFEFAGATLGSDIASTNLLAYTATLGNGLSATISAEDPVFRRSVIFSQTNNPGGVTVNANLANFAQSQSPAEVFIGYTGGVPTRYSFVDVIQRSRMPDVVGALRLDQAWGSAQLSAAVHELNVGNVANGAGTGTGSNGLAHPFARIELEIPETSMTLLRSSLLATAAAFATMGAAHAADLPVKKAVPVEYVRVCGAYGAGFFYVPGTDTCLRISGRARYGGGYMTASTRQAGTNAGDSAGYQARLRINLDARTQTAYGTLRAFVRLDAGSRTGYARSGTQARIGQAYDATGVDQAGHAQQFMNVDKAFIQFAGLTAGRASSFFDFYAHDFEIYGATAGSDVSSTNLLAYTVTAGEGLSATLSIEDPVFRRSPIYAPAGTASPVSPVFVSYIRGAPIGVSSVDSIQRERLPDVVGVLRVDQGWGSAQLSAAVHELNVGNIAVTPAAGANVSVAHTRSVEGWAVQGGLKINAPFVAPGDALYLQSAYADGAQMYTGYCAFTGCYAQLNNGFQGQKIYQSFSDATVNPFTGQLQTSQSFSAVASFLHYWTPEWRSAVFGSYGEQDFSRNARLAQGALYNVLSFNGAANLGSNAVGAPGTRFYQLSQALRDTYQFVAGGSIIWSPVRDLDIGVEAFYTQIGVKHGRAIDSDKSPTAYANVAGINSGTFVPRTVTQDSVSQVRFRVQRDF